MQNCKPTATRLAIAIPAVLLAMILWIVIYKPAHRITVINLAPVSVDSLTVTVCGNNYDFELIPSGFRVSSLFEITGDSGFVVRGRFSDGTQITGGFGYVTKNIAKQSVTIFVHGDGTITGTQQ